MDAKEVCHHILGFEKSMSLPATPTIKGSRQLRRVSLLRPCVSFKGVKASVCFKDLAC